MECSVSDFKHRDVESLLDLAENWMDKVCGWSNENEPVTIDIPDDQLIDHHNYGVELYEELLQRIQPEWLCKLCAIVSELDDALNFTEMIISWMRENEN